MWGPQHVFTLLLLLLISRHGQKTHVIFPVKRPLLSPDVNKNCNALTKNVTNLIRRIFLNYFQQLCQNQNPSHIYLIPTVRETVRPHAMARFSLLIYGRTSEASMLMLFFTKV
jgi:hypothetical protein